MLAKLSPPLLGNTTRPILKLLTVHGSSPNSPYSCSHQHCNIEPLMKDCPYKRPSLSYSECMEHDTRWLTLAAAVHFLHLFCPPLHRFHHSQSPAVSVNQLHITSQSKCVHVIHMTLLKTHKSPVKLIINKHLIHILYSF